MVDFKKIGESMRANVVARDKAKEIRELIDAEIAELEPDKQSRFWDYLFEGVVGKRGAEVEESKQAMSYDDARTFARAKTFPFGKHQDKLVIDVPADYLEWLAYQPDFRKELERYMVSSYYRDVHAKE